MKIQTIKNLFPAEILSKVKEEYVQTIASREMDFCVEFGRLYKNGQPYFNYLHRSLIYDLAKELWGKNIIPSYVFMSHYNQSSSHCPQHRDRFPQCLHTIDVVVAQKEKWGIYIDFKEYLLDENEAIVYSGVNHWHHRGRIKPGNEVSLIFFHFTSDVYKGMNLN